MTIQNPKKNRETRETQPSQPSQRSEPMTSKRGNWLTSLPRRCYDWVLSWAPTPYAVPALFLLAFAESSFFPVPPDVLLIAMCIGTVQKSYRFATWCAIGSVVGGMAGYGIGYYLWDNELVKNFFYDYIPGVNESSVTITITAASVNIEATIITPSQARAQWPTPALFAAPAMLVPALVLCACDTCSLRSALWVFRIAVSASCRRVGCCPRRAS